MKNQKMIVVIAIALIAIDYFITHIFFDSDYETAVKNYPDKNVQAFLKMIRFAEGTDGVNGYRTMFTGKLFDNNYIEHPNINNCYGSLCSTAAGAYQFLYKTWKELKAKLELKDFSPYSQDLAAIELLRRRGALDYVKQGNFELAVQAVNKEWASMPGSPYGQPTKDITELINIYQNNGGTIV